MVAAAGGLHVRIGEEIQHGCAHTDLVLQWNPTLWTTLKSGHLQYCGHFVRSRMHLHNYVCVQSNPLNVEPPIFRKADRFPSFNSK